jgi:hypothetical protein
MIYIYPIGGIGNMFYHIASIWTLAKDNGDELGLVNIQQKIQNLINDTREADMSHAYQYMYLFKRFPIFENVSKPKLVYPFQYVPLEYKVECLYDGYFQHETYFKHRRSEIIELLKPEDSFSPLINKYKDYFGHISLHIRRHMRVGQGTAFTPEYCMNKIAKCPNDLKVLVFSDDMDWCRENLIGDRFVFVEEVDYIAFYVMTRMKYHILGANSSFSWWGHWMCELEEKQII